MVARVCRGFMGTQNRVPEAYTGVRVGGGEQLRGYIENFPLDLKGSVERTLGTSVPGKETEAVGRVESSVSKKSFASIYWRIRSNLEWRIQGDRSNVWGFLTEHCSPKDFLSVRYVGGF